MTCTWLRMAADQAVVVYTRKGFPLVSHWAEKTRASLTHRILVPSENSKIEHFDFMYLLHQKPLQSKANKKVTFKKVKFHKHSYLNVDNYILRKQPIKLVKNIIFFMQSINKPVNIGVMTKAIHTATPCIHIDQMFFFTFSTLTFAHSCCNTVMKFNKNPSEATCPSST